jgi:hypothetical protein
VRYHPNGDISKGKAKTIYALFLEKYLDGARYGKARYLWCIGDGTNVRIWTDEWLPRELKASRPRGLVSAIDDNALLP